MYCIRAIRRQIKTTTAAFCACAARQDIQARNGDIVIALLEDEATCKTLNITPDGVWLMPENPAYPPINGTGCQILGVVKAVYREY